jgi:putative PIN family toxin of toxin-antitoxin system
MRVVADANVLVSAAIARSPQAPSVLIMEAVFDERIELVASPTLLAEVIEVLARPRLRRYVTPGRSRRVRLLPRGTLAPGR